MTIERSNQGVDERGRRYVDATITAAPGVLATEVTQFFTQKVPMRRIYGAAVQVFPAAEPFDKGHAGAPAGTKTTAATAVTTALTGAPVGTTVRIFGN
jgi:hypothetical protein